jgi:rhamnosyltransferase
MNLGQETPQGWLLNQTNSTKRASVGVAIVTHNSKEHLPHSLPHVVNSPLKPRVLVVDSSSKDGTVEMAKELGAETLVIPRPQFNHGLTRERARKYLGTDIAVMMTPDAHPTDEGMLTRLIAPLIEGSASAAYARQIPHDGADIFEAFPRYFNCFAGVIGSPMSPTRSSSIPTVLV